VNGLRRHAWGGLWAKAPWDGLARPPEPLRMPNTVAAPLPEAKSTKPRSLRLMSFAAMLTQLPWAVPVAAVAAVVPVETFEIAGGSMDDSVEMSASDTLTEALA